MMGWLLMIEAAFMAVPLLTGIVYGEESSVKAFACSALITCGAGALMTFGIRPRDTDMHRREGLLLTASVWVFFSLFGMLPFLFDNALSSITDAFFEALSGFTTTGASVITDVESASHSVLMWRAIMNSSMLRLRALLTISCVRASARRQRACGLCMCCSPCCSPCCCG